jgi:hypothetical protein
MVIVSAGIGAVSDPGLTRAFDWFMSQDDVVTKFSDAIRQSFDEVFDGQRTGRYHLGQLSKTEKTYVGTKVEIVVQDVFGLSRGKRMDFDVAGEDVDSKWSMRSGGWMIPMEAVGELCLCITGDDATSRFSVGLIRANDTALNEGRSRDKKRTLSEGGRSSMRWLIEDGQLAENLLLHLDTEIRDTILDYDLSGQSRINNLFRLVQLRPVRREVVLTVARQDDGPKRVRDARPHLQPLGIVVLGHQGSHTEIAAQLGLPVIPKGTWISCRLVPAAGASTNTVTIAGSTWRVACADDDDVPGPLEYQ